MSRAKGTGCLVKRGKYYTARWTVDGKVYTRSTKCEKKSEALKKLAEFVHPYQTTSSIETLENLQSQIHVLENGMRRTPRKEAVKLQFVIDVYKNDVDQSAITEATEVDYDCKLNRLKKFVAPKEYVYQLTEADAQAFMLDIKSKCTEKTYNTYLKVFKRIFDVAMKHDTNIRRNVFAKLKFINEGCQSWRRELKNEEIEKLFESAKKIGEEELLLFKLGAYTGMRRSDCMKLKWSEVDLPERKIRRLPIKTMKTGRKAIIPIVDELQQVLEAADKSSEFVLPKISSYSHWQISNLVERVFKSAGIKIFFVDENKKKHFLTGFHALRHTIASKLHRSGTPINQIKTILGHTKIDMSLSYAHIAEEDLKMPDLSGSTMQVQVKKTTYENVMKRKRADETFDDVVVRLLSNRLADEEAVAKIAAEKEALAAKEKQELDDMIDEVMRSKQAIRPTHSALSQAALLLPSSHQTLHQSRLHRALSSTLRQSSSLLSQ